MSLIRLWRFGPKDFFEIASKHCQQARLVKKTKPKLERRCPRLGGPVPFNYCMDAGDVEQPCFKIVDCWWETFDIVRYLRDNLPEDQFTRLMEERPRPKIANLVELIEQAKSRKD